MFPLILFIGSVVISGFLALKITENRLASFILFFVFLGISRAFIMPGLLANNELANMEEEMLKVPMFRAIKEQEPEFYRQFQQQLKADVKKGASLEQMITIARTQIQPLLTKKLPTASNQALIEYGQALSTTISELRRKSSDACVQLLFPQANQFRSALDHVSPSNQNLVMKATEKVIVEQTNIAPPGDATVQPLLLKINQVMDRKHGQNAMAVFQNPYQAKDKSCGIIDDFYIEILKLEDNKAASLLRYLFANG